MSSCFPLSWRIIVEEHPFQPSLVLSDPVPFITLLCSWAQHGPSFSVLQPSSDKWLHSHIPDLTRGSPTWNRGKSRWELSLCGNQVLLQDPHQHCPPLTNLGFAHITALPWSQGRTELLKCKPTPAIPQHSHLKQQQCFNAESEVVYSKDSYKALCKSGIFEQMPSSLKLLTYLQ